MCYDGPGSGSSDYGKLTIGDGLMVLSGDGTDGPYVASSRVDYCWYRTQASVTPCTHSGAGYTFIDGNSHSVSCPYCTEATVAQPHDFGSYGECDCHLISIANDGDNSSVLEHWNGVADRAMTINALRAYFNVDISDVPTGVREFVMNLDESETTSLSPIPSPSREGRWYGLQGRKLSGKPTAKGLYIVNGKKIVMK